MGVSQGIRNAEFEAIGVCSQVKLAVSAGALATSDDGAWVCLANKALGWWVGGV